MDDADIAAILRRLDAVERNHTLLASSITNVVEKVDSLDKSFSEHQVGQIIAAFRDAIADAGLRLDDADHQDEAREDFRFLRRFRQTWESSAKKVGNATLTAVILVALTIVGSGFWVWINSSGRG